jgi:type I restriction enzyme S subunit
LFGTEFPFITPTDLANDQTYATTSRFLSRQGYESLKRILLPPDSVCFVCIGATIGKICLTQRPSFTNQQINSVVVNKAHHEPRFVFHLLRFNTSRIKGIAGGAATPIVNKTAFCEVDVSVPGLQAQQNIGAILGAYDDLIENNTRRIQILEQMAQMLYREWFVNFRFPGHEKVKMVESEMGMIPDGWAVYSLRDVAEVNELSVKTTVAPPEIAYVDIASVSTNSIDAVTKIPFSEAPSRARRIVREGDTIWSTVRPNRKSFALILRPEAHMIVSTGFAVLTPRGIPYSYLYLATTTDAFADYLMNHATGAAYPAVNSGDFEAANMLIPPTKLLDAFHRTTEPLLGLQQILKERNRNLRTTRDLLLPKLVSGEINVEQIEQEVLAEMV